MEYWMGVFVHTFAGIVGIQRGWSPGFLNVARTALLTLVSTRVVLASADQSERILGIGEITAVSMAVTHAPATDRHVLDAVVVLDRHRTRDCNPGIPNPGHIFYPKTGLKLPDWLQKSHHK